MKRIDLNADIGEGFPHDLALMEVVTSVNVCSGLHAGSRELAEETIQSAVQKGLRVGLHPGFPDRENFGRSMPGLVALQTWIMHVKKEVLQFHDFPGIAYLKFHGALYNAIHENSLNWREDILELVRTLRLPLLGISNGGLQELAECGGVTLISEGFPERKPIGNNLLPRSEPGAVLNSLDEICDQAMDLADSGVNSLCIHGDRPDAVEVASAIRDRLSSAGWEIAHG